ncbi:MAG: dihydrofolate reductase [Propionibacterium sp.]|nr:dihydrofolate reductase [Propionibacterium sp.]
MSRTTTAHLFHSVDGVVEHPHLWQFDAFGPEDGQRMNEALAPVTDTVIGRKLWEEWSEYWPGADDPFGQWVNPIHKHVIGSSLPSELPWNSTPVVGDPIEHVRSLREQEGGTIAVLGGIETVRSLFLAGLIDVLTLTTHPVVAGEGRRLFDGVPTARLRLLEVRQTSSGNAVLTYGLRTDG